MEKFAFGLIAALVILSGVASGMYMSHRSGEVLRSCEMLAGEVSDLKEELQTAREEIQVLAEGMHRPPAARIAPAASDSDSQPADGTPPNQAAAAPTLAAMPHEEIRTFVAVALDEERKQREDERKKQREDFRERLEARRKETEALREGPYDRYNLKVNSLAKALSLNDLQKQAYFELAKQTQEKFQAERKKVAQAAVANQAAREPGSGKGREDRTATRQLSEGVQKEFSAAVQGLLTPAQFESYNQLSGSARSFQSLGQVSPPGEQADPPGGGLQPGFRGGAPGGGGGGRQGQGQGPRGR